MWLPRHKPSRYILENHIVRVTAYFVQLPATILPACAFRAYSLAKGSLVGYFGFLVAGSLPLGIYENI